MVLTKFYGVSSTFNEEDNSYTFSDDAGTFIIDGGGSDTINASASIKNIYIDLRPGTHSYEGQKSNFITSSNQLTISHGSNIENIETGFGSDIIVGNQLSNTIITGTGDDLIYAGEGMDTIYPGEGSDIIDLSEDLNSQDKVVIQITNEKKDLDTIYGFKQGLAGDIIQFVDYGIEELNFLPVVDYSNIPSGYITDCLVRVFGEDINDTANLSSYFNEGGPFENLKLLSGESAIFIITNSQNTGDIQHIYFTQKSDNFVVVDQLVQLKGNYLDIDNWSLENFIV